MRASEGLGESLPMIGRSEKERRGLLVSGQGGWGNKEKGHDQETNVMKVVHHPIERHVDK